MGELWVDYFKKDCDGQICGECQQKIVGKGMVGYLIDDETITDTIVLVSCIACFNQPPP